MRHSISNSYIWSNTKNAEGKYNWGKIGKILFVVSVAIAFAGLAANFASGYKYLFWFHEWVSTRTPEGGIPHTLYGEIYYASGLTKDIGINLLFFSIGMMVFSLKHIANIKNYFFLTIFGLMIAMGRSIYSIVNHLTEFINLLDFPYSFLLSHLLGPLGITLMVCGIGGECWKGSSGNPSFLDKTVEGYQGTKKHGRGEFLFAIGIVIAVIGLITYFISCYGLMNILYIQEHRGIESIHFYVDMMMRTYIINDVGICIALLGISIMIYAIARCSLTSSKKLVKTGAYVMAMGISIAMGGLIYLAAWAINGFTMGSYPLSNILPQTVYPLGAVMMLCGIGLITIGLMKYDEKT